MSDLYYPITLETEEGDVFAPLFSDPNPGDADMSLGVQWNLAYADPETVEVPEWADDAVNDIWQDDPLSDSLLVTMKVGDKTYSLNYLNNWVPIEETVA